MRYSVRLFTLLLEMSHETACARKTLKFSLNGAELSLNSVNSENLRNH